MRECFTVQRYCWAYCSTLFTYDVRCFWGIFDLPDYPSQFTTQAYLVKSDSA